MPGLLGRRGARIAIVVVAVLVLLVALAPRLIPAGKVRDLVIARARAATGADVSFGTASVRLFPRLSVAVADGRIAGTGAALRAATGQPNALVSYRASLDRVEVSLALWPLLHRRVEIGRVRLVRPRVELVTAPPASAAGEASAVPPAAAGAPVALAVAALEVRDGGLTWREEGTNRAVLIEGWEQTLTAGDLTALAARLRALAAPGGASAPGGGEVRLGLTARLGTLTLERFGPVSPLQLRDLTLAAEAVLPPAGDALRLTITRAAWGGIELAGEAAVSGGADGGRRLTGTWRLREMELPPLLAALLPLAPPVPGPAGAWLATAPVTAGRLTLAGGLSLPWPLPQPSAPDLFVRG
ncbi:MAG: AsmA family protein, partial [Candidatus Krumholzibacteriia bacterium]